MPNMDFEGTATWKSGTECDLTVKGKHIATVSPPPAFRGRSLGITTLTILQLIIGVIHIFFGFWLLTANQNIIDFTSQTSNTIYAVYTIIFGLSAASFAFGIWLQEKWGLYGTIATSIFVTVVDSFTLLNLPSIPGVPKFAAGTEITYSLFVIFYLAQYRLRDKRISPQTT